VCVRPTPLFFVSCRERSYGGVTAWCEKTLEEFEKAEEPTRSQSKPERVVRPSVSGSAGPVDDLVAQPELEASEFPLPEQEHARPTRRLAKAYLGSLAEESGTMKLGNHRWTKTAVKWPNQVPGRIDAYPFVVLAITLLAIFMTSTPMITRSFSVDLPGVHFASPMPKALREDAQVVSVMRDGAVYYGNTRINAEDLAERIRESVRKGADQKIYIRADARAKYMDIERVLDEISKTGIQNVSFFAEKLLPKD
jgi:biopolymer transport protein ExbD